jgi:hypothetical protein
LRPAAEPLGVAGVDSGEDLGAVGADSLGGLEVDGRGGVQSEPGVVVLDVDSPATLDQWLTGQHSTERAQPSPTSPPSTACSASPHANANTWPAPVLAPGEVLFETDSNAWAVERSATSRPGYLPEPGLLASVATALDRLGLVHPAGFTNPIIFRVCPTCWAINVVRDDARRPRIKSSRRTKSVTFGGRSWRTCASSFWSSARTSPSWRGVPPAGRQPRPLHSLLFLNRAGQLRPGRVGHSCSTVVAPLAHYADSVQFGRRMAFSSVVP